MEAFPRRKRSVTSKQRPGEPSPPTENHANLSKSTIILICRRRRRVNRFLKQEGEVWGMAGASYEHALLDLQYPVRQGQGRFLTSQSPFCDALPIKNLNRT